ncbi:MAG: AraC family transcriptional regulator [Bacteroidales bacterium]|nr:AraC family transcriptional regulator [Bacteroidales bacterium]
MEQALREIGIDDLRKYFPQSESGNLGKDFFIANIKYGQELADAISILKHPCRYNGYFVVFCAKGRMCLDVNLKTFEIGKNSVVINIPGNIFRVSDIQPDEHEEAQLVLIALSADFVSNIHFNFTALYNESMTAMNNPCFYLTDEEFEACSLYYELTVNLIRTNSPQLKDAICALLSSVFYYLGYSWSEKLLEAKRSTWRPSLRSKVIFDTFIRLVTEFHNTERGMVFYADKLCLTPKYLSKLVKNISGRSAPEWIDAYVILEAKNLLKYSDLSIKEIVFQLNFRNQSVFYKFFKSHTGMTPTEYRKS